ncbi:MAG: cyclopropane-fatty-acyl-phospholipid synthase family protein [Pseudomonadota bacterium]|jgi:cyclopropane-fatty-acyl-phospholipid synthase|uniref:Methyltransferase, cyclopropane fatty acid synthase n=1 Tax=Ralstonia pickettii OR214 TaxID=1264675 RepID=R0DZI3_RALPI|nr:MULTISPECIES: cyclopropane-fatty-acyl-phospholipid synthase family protein [Ralstonia]MEA3270122.1 cyclopropane-fatty-acyl-phospholipid synthase family protein [Pseudomonadota bacterium]ENZ75354.1 methyltransferase, cyclopropane fatty acid synthase [Ralstonia pickettii OR214]MBL4779630.1 class I SAM-dependent methyltransferase [Ralstonia sp.]MCM3583590.1 cyclopropane-fatty-acyl-phospholipid synthase family protein [Ralstonia pickettii]MDR9387234.1 cyclopropane-fatty-acyl-phospholipid syntha
MNSTKAFIGSVPSTDTEPALRILRRLLAGMEKPPALRLWNDTLHGHDTAVDFTLVVRDPSLLRQLVVARSPLLLADAYFRGVLDIEGDLYGALRLKNHFESIHLSWRDKLALLKDALMLPAPDLGEIKPDAGFASRVARRFAHRHSRHSDRAAISFHYDVSNKFYGLWLDEERVYSCAYFEQPSDSLDTAQRNKLEHVCRKLRLRPGERLLDIGCGWGALVCWAAREHGVHAHGITLSERQLEYARERIRIEGLQDRVTVELRDYRDLEGEGVYDKVSSIGMFEHVGLRNLPAYYAVVRRMLKPGGLFLNHGITHDEEGWNKTAATEFINRYVFPDGELDCISNIQLGMERAGFEIHDVEGLRPHYAMTLRHWVHRLEAQRDAAIAEVGEAAYRVWRLYMAACALEFEAGGSGIYQILASNRHPGKWPVPMTRRDLYRSRPHWDWGN